MGVVELDQQAGHWFILGTEIRSGKNGGSGPAVLSYDRLGIGKSTNPNALTEVNNMSLLEI